MANSLFNIDRNTSTITVTSTYHASIERVWAAWTESNILDQWWAPHPWKAVTKEMNFIPKGRWLYAMVSPEGQKVWSLLQYIDIVSHHYFTAEDAFCDENGVKSIDSPPSSKWHNAMVQTPSGTTVTNTIEFENVEAMDSLLEMGFREGFQMGLNNLEQYLSEHNT
ncbi:SRPBCC family protein [Sphingobacterium yanglingense]|uniref:Uncharacterized protein YndB with AHSA1/START domain n=1 Tax=Sphingobacterium yanglingense TaxID=1437280 RepID=A0A4R6WFX8_9SPHI|nr:SRPBCC domain-containing protein [Sphingobacterium yanglingense]TDQ77037.1 uncharacterized protein YndB with AHSA1/START domain [Sphingobacterium yanglingense]